MRSSRWTTTVAVAAIAAAALSGCTAAGSASTSTPTPVSTADWPTAQLYHEGPATAELVVPTGAKSLHVDFSCTGGLYTVSPATGIDSRSGMCGGAQSFDFDVTAVAPGTHLRVDISVPADSRLTADLRYSTRTFAPDRTTRTQCAALSSITEAYTNADAGHDAGDVTDAQWSEQTAKAKTDLTALAATARAHPEKAGLLGPVIPQLAEWLTGNGDHPGGFAHAPLGDFTAADALVGQIYSANGTPIVVNAKYGG